MTRLLLASVLFLSFAVAQAQETPDSIRIGTPDRDTLLTSSYASRYRPSKASLYAAILPGLGQVYTKKYWKLPLVYGGIIATGYAISYYQDLYKDYKYELYYILETGASESPSGYTEDQLRPAINSVKRNRDLMIVVMAGVYILQIIDAHVDAHLKEFDVNPNLQVRLRPLYESNPFVGNQAGFSLTIRF